MLKVECWSWIQAPLTLDTWYLTETLPPASNLLTCIS